MIKKRKRHEINPTPFKSCDEGISQVCGAQGIVKDYKISKIKSISYYKCGVL